MIDMMACCPYCGQTRLVQVPEDLPEPEREGEAQKEAIAGCSCKEGEDARKRLRITYIAHENITEMFEAGFPDIAKILHEAVDMVYERTIKKLTVSEPDGGVATMHFSKSGIVVEWRVTKKQEAATGL